MSDDDQAARLLAEIERRRILANEDHAKIAALSAKLRHARRDALIRAQKAVQDCPAVGEAGLLCKKADAISAICLLPEEEDSPQ